LRAYNRYIILLALVTCLVNILLAFSGQNSLEIYFVVNLIAYLLLTVLYAYLNPRAKRALTAISAVAFASLLVIIFIRVLEILSD